jgi:hypothetical protein
MKTRLLLTVSMLVGVPLASASAQQPLHVGLSAGLTPALEGAWHRGYRGSHFQASLEITPLDRRLGVRLDGFVHNMTRKSYPGLSGITDIIGGTASALVGLGPLEQSFTPYLLAGVGTYRTEYGSSKEWHFGISAGGGVRLQTGRAAVFAEARLHEIADGSTPRLTPFSFGIRF